MSYARIGPDSHVYIWSDGDMIHVSVSNALKIHNALGSMPHPAAGSYRTFTQRHLCAYALIELEEMGVLIPTSVYDRLTDEIRQKGTKV